MRALSIRQPFAELILRGIKTVELRSRSTNILAERFYIYAAKKKVSVAGGRLPVWSKELTGERPPAWMIELAEQVGMLGPEKLERLPRGVIVGSAVIEKVTRSGDLFGWHLVDVERLAKQRKPTGRPQPVWFKPFG